MTEFVSTASCQQRATLQTRHCADSRSRIHFHHPHVQYGVHCPTSGWPCFSPRYVPPDSPSPAFSRPLSHISFPIAMLLPPSVSHLFPHRHPSPALCLTSLSSQTSFSSPLSHISFLTVILLLPSVSQFFPHRHPSPALCLTALSSSFFSCPLPTVW